jgi:hypothetical protein
MTFHRLTKRFTLKEKKGTNLEWMIYSGGLPRCFRFKKKSWMNWKWWIDNITYFKKKGMLLTKVSRPSERPYPISTTRWQLGVTGKHDRNNSSRLETNCFISSGSLFFNMWKTCKYGKRDQGHSYFLKQDIFMWIWAADCPWLVH